MELFELDEKMKRGICGKLIEYDPDIVEIVQFGSSVYAPEHARDLDLLVITKKRKDYGVYLDATVEIYDELDFSYNIDVIPHQVGKELKKSFAAQIFGSSGVIFGDGSYLKKLIESIDPTFEEAKAMLRVARRYLKDAEEEGEEEVRDMHIRNCFNSLFHSARLGAMTFLAIENKGWGEIKKKLPQPYKKEFEEFIRTLHVDYFYNGNYPENYEEAFGKWYERVEDFVKRLEGRNK